MADEFTPTPDEIAERAAEIRKGWSDDEHARRRETLPRSDYFAPHVEQRARARLADRLAAQRAARRAS